MRSGVAFAFVLFGCGESTPSTNGPTCVDPPRGDRVDWFEDATARSGLSFDYATTGFKGGALGVADLDGDGLPEIIASSRVGGAAYYKNKGGLRFERRDDAGLDPAFAGHAIGIGDLDNDGDEDVVLASKNLVVVLGNDGAGALTEVARWTDTGSTEHVFLVDLDGDGRLDIHLGNYDTQVGEQTQNRLYMNRGGFTFASIVLPVKDLTWTAAAFDVDGDGDLDLHLANDTLLADDGIPHVAVWPPDQLLRNDGVDGDGMPVLTDIAVDMGLANPRSSMGGLVADFDRDGALDLFVTDFGPNRMFTRVDGVFQDHAAALGIAAPRRRNRSCPDQIDGVVQVDCLLLSWSGAISDFDGDGEDDLVVTNGDTGSQWFPPVLVFTRGSDGTFTERSSAIPCGDWRTLIATDLDGDGDQDLVMTPASGPLTVYETVGEPAATSWLRVSLHGTATNRDGMGAVVRVALTDGRVLVGAVGDSGVIHGAGPAEAWFTIPDSEVSTVRVSWPSGRQTDVAGPVHGNLVVEEGPS